MTHIFPYSDRKKNLRTELFKRIFLIKVWNWNSVLFDLRVAYLNKVNVASNLPEKVTENVIIPNIKNS